ncbi:Mut7-C ubiquitin/RNAse domain-containing protein [Rhodohalobacter sulfatireducens]|uniref:Mut7-C ubiquitin/RNAse domain-containing protein n=1 Tax=Rhodohalobacter sulfatireducens TaxID=2911366 RepID=A0ABS9K8S0_9BACT|nr:Mut7-C ubiquitin/RNAse domain-containing protein [Rhodohalobacter sulfatireducens]MCG2587250.1 Mut7-C ubiquitin/RNAse domain-containing protein [Rhodohalobacter sulfatireducens]MDR9367013.1 Mut7-C ubiquitin/RNAse domain-containing protein [Balneolaceae bacterium]MDR9409721.1 Mut7-C ubiquitin/RNAse domain-containing protein [Balneolaceae bacterium]
MSKPSNLPIQPTLRFYGDLVDLVSQPISDNRIIERSLSEPTSVKDLIEGCGVPHTEVDFILADDKPVDFSYKITGNERISVYPFFISLEIPKSERLQISKPDELLFLADVNLGKLAKHLRLAGFDTAYKNDATDSEIIKQMQKENRILLTRDRKLLMRNAVKIGYLPRSDDSTEQLEEVFKRFDLFDEIQPYSRCVNCNGMLERVSKESVMDQLEPLTKKYFDEFSQCPDCGQVYWKGSHRNRLDSRLERLLKL